MGKTGIVRALALLVVVTPVLPATGGTGSGAVYYTFDPQGNVSQRYDGNGNLLAPSMNDAYGTESSTGNAGG